MQSCPVHGQNRENRDTTVGWTAHNQLIPFPSQYSPFPSPQVPYRLVPTFPKASSEQHPGQAQPGAIRGHSRWDTWGYFHPHSNAEHTAPGKSRPTKAFGKRGCSKPSRAPNPSSGCAGAHSTCLGGPGTLRAKLWQLENINNSKPVCDSRCPTHPPKVTRSSYSQKAHCYFFFQKVMNNLPFITQFFFFFQLASSKRMRKQRKCSFPNLFLVHCC